MEKLKTRKITKDFHSANQFRVSVEHNGYQGGDAGHGGYTKITFEDLGSTAFEVECDCSPYGDGYEVADNNLYISEPEKVTINFMGDSERDSIIEGLKFIINELEKNPEVTENHEEVTEHIWVD